MSFLKTQYETEEERRKIMRRMKGRRLVCEWIMQLYRVLTHTVRVRDTEEFCPWPGRMLLSS